LTKSSAASIRQRLLNLARVRGENFDYVLKTYLIQRLLYRLGSSKFRDRFLLKGAMLFWVWGGDAHRPTRDIDLLGYGGGDIEILVADFRDICSVVAEDGLEFDLASIRGIEIKEDALYQGVRITGQSSLDSARITFQVDIGFGDAVSPGAEVATVPSFLDFPDPELNVYPVYTLIAEKFQAMIMLGIANSRIKDFYDLWVIASKMEIEGNLLVEAIRATFGRRETALSEYGPSIFEPPFTADENKQKQWLAFLRKKWLGQRNVL
jgi:predicted nucleotidyltransferase component of viral defense system